MASSPKPLLVIFLLVLFSAKQSNARQSNFFSKFMHYNSNDQNPKIPISLVPTPAPAPAPTPEVAEVVSLTSPAPAPAPSDTETNEYAYGLYGHDFKDQFSSSKKIPTTIDRENQIVNEELAAKSFETPTNNYNGYTNYPNNNNYNSNNGYEMKPEGMSDTRFLENGRYYHDVKNVNNYNNNQYESERGSSRNDQTYYFPNNEKYEFDTMDEYDRYQKSQKLPYWP